MEPALVELSEQGDGGDEIAAIARLTASDAAPPPGARVVARFGEIATVRFRRGDLVSVRESVEVTSLKAPRLFAPDVELIEEADESDIDLRASDQRRPEGLSETGRGVLLGVVDWGFDFTHPDFRNADGTTRIVALWDQRAPAGDNRYGYGAIHDRVSIDRALASSDPFAALGYHPADGDGGGGAHGTHVLSIAGGDGGRGPAGLAPGADLVCVHMGSITQARSGKLGDSVTLLEAVDFIDRTAWGEHGGLSDGAPAPRPWVINLSMGKHGEQHDGSTLVEQGLDAALRSAPGRAIAQSVGNYRERAVHACGRLRPNESRQLTWQVSEADETPNELEVWYSGRDRLSLQLHWPDGSLAGEAEPGQMTPLVVGGRRVGALHNRLFEPNTLDNTAQIYLYKEAPAGDYAVTILGGDVVDGRYHCWIEREPARPRYQSRFSDEDADRANTTGTICNGLRTIAVGAYDAHDPAFPMAPFSSAGPTRDGRVKPDLCAPGVKVLAARSQRRGDDGASALTRMSGTSMASPHVAGTLALMFEAAGRPLRIEETRNLLLSATHAPEIQALSPEEHEAALQRMGSGRLDTAAAVRNARNVAARPVRDQIEAAAEAPPERPPSTPRAPKAPAPEELEAMSHQPYEAEPYPEDIEAGPGDLAAISDASSQAPDEPDAGHDDLDADPESSRRRRRGGGGLPFQVQLPIGGGSPGLAVPIGGGGSPFAFTVPLGGQPAPQPPSPPQAQAPAAPAPVPVAAPEPVTAKEPCSCKGGDLGVDVAEDWETQADWPQVLPAESDAWDYAPPVEAAPPARAFGPSTVDAAETVLEQPDLGRRPDRFVRGLVSGVRAQHLVEGRPARIYDALVLGRDAELAAELESLFEVVAAPGRSIARSLRPGDLLIRRLDGGRGHAAVLTSGELVQADDLESSGLAAESAAGGSFAWVVEPGARPHMREHARARRIADPAGRLPIDQLILRLHGETASGAWGEGFAEADLQNREFVRWIQSSLNTLMNAGLTVDGQYGPMTRSAVRAFQQAQGLTVDGIVGPRTESALRQLVPGAGAPTGALPDRCLGLPERQTVDNFEFGRAEVLPRHQPIIVNTAFCILTSQRSPTPITTLTIVGHTDPVGGDTDNDALGRQRAEAVRDQILNALHRISGRPPRLTVTIETRGEREPVPGDPGLSRRVEIVAPFAFPRGRTIPPVPKPPVPAPPTPRPVLDPPRWAPILRPLLGPHASLQTGNNVRHLIDGEHHLSGVGTYRAMVEEIKKAKGEDSFIYLLGWVMDDMFEMIPCDPDSTASRLLLEAGKRGVQIRALLWEQSVVFRSLQLLVAASAQRINDLHSKHGFDAAAILDGETLSLGSHHQKVLIVKNENGLIAFVGGLDIMSDRIRRCPTTPQTGGVFTAQADLPELTDLRVLDTPEGMEYLGDSSGGSGGPKASDPLHDVHCRIDGPAAWDLLKTFHLRWEHHGKSAAIDKRSPLRGDRRTPRPPRKTSSPPSESSTGATCTVAIARTFNPVTSAPGIPKERDIRNLLLGAIGAARRYIYLEDQYMVSLEAARALNAAIPRLEHVTILIGASEVVTDTPCIWTFRRDFVNTLTRGLSAHNLAKVRVFRLATPPNPSPLPPCGSKAFTPTFGQHTYVHAKSWFFDDELAVIGTANCNRRGWQHDGEVDAFIFDDARPSGSQLTFCQRTRMDLWAEHLNAPSSRLADGVASASLWLAPPAGARVLRYCPNDGKDTGKIPEALCGDFVRDKVDPPAP